jgi:hypothetical protein
MKWLSAFVLAATIATTGCDYCGPEQHAITTSANTLMMGGDIATRQIQYVTYRLTEPPASHDAFEFVFNTLEGSTNGEGVALTLSGTDAITQEVTRLHGGVSSLVNDNDANLHAPPYSLKGKTVIPFNTNAGYGEGSSFGRLGSSVRNARFWKASSPAAGWKGMDDIWLAKAHGRPKHNNRLRLG